MTHIKQNSNFLGRHVEQLRTGMALAVLTVLASSAFAQTTEQKLPTVTLTAGIHVIQAEVAQSNEQRAIGLMNRPTLGANAGMLFVFEQAAGQCFWMKNTLVPLSIAFVKDDGTVAQINDMQPQSLTEHCSQEPVRFALEVNQSWFAKRGIKPGDKLSGPPFNKAKN